LSLLSVLESVADLFGRLSRNKATQADIAAGEAFAEFWPSLSAAMASEKGQKFIAALNEAFALNAPPSPPAAVSESPDSQPEAGSHGGSIYTGPGAVE